MGNAHSNDHLTSHATYTTTTNFLRANPFPKVTDLFCRLPLPTFFYQLEAAHLGDLLRLSVRPTAKAHIPPAFHGPSRVLRTQYKYRAFPTTRPLRRLTRFQGVVPLKRKENSSRGSCQRRQVHLRCRSAPLVGTGILTGFPFDRSANCAFHTELPHLLGSTHPGPTAVLLEPFSTSVFKVPI
jgi:hypothetical protein